MDRLQEFINEVMPLHYDTVFTIGVREDGSICLLGGLAAYNAAGEQVAVVSGFDCDHRQIENLALRLGQIQPDPADLAYIAYRQLGRTLSNRIAG